MKFRIKKCYIFVPGLSEKYRTGGLLVIQDVAKILRELGIDAQWVSTHEMHADTITPARAFDETNKHHDSSSTLFLTTWGPLAEKHIKLIKQNVVAAKIIHYAQSFGWGVNIPKGIPIVCVSRYVMSQFALNLPGHNLFIVSPFLHGPFVFSNAERDIDILVHARKQNSYCLNHLVPALKHANLDIEMIEEWISQEKFAELLNRAKIFLYVTEHHKAGLFKKLPGEGFGLPALEASACGTIVASNLLGGVTDFLTPGKNCLSIEGDAIHDTAKIKKATDSFVPNQSEASEIHTAYSKASAISGWTKILEQLQ